jgi:beta-lactamase class D
MYFFPAKLYFKLLSAFLLTFVFFSANQTVYSQKSRSVQRKTETPKKTAGKKGEPQGKTDKNKKESSKKTETAKSKKETQNSSKKITTPKSKKETQAELKKKAEEKKQNEAEAAKKRAAQVAALEEKRRRDQAIRAAQAKKRALENSFRNETVSNILKDDISGEDMEIRRAAVNALGSHAGTIVVMEAQTGKILTMVNQDWAIRKSFKPCSTIKLVTAVAGLDKNLIDSDGSIRNKRFRLDLTDALAYSNNSYFQLVGSNLGSETMISYAQRLGLGQPTGINADGESIGRLPFGNNNARIYSHGDDTEVTPLQLGVMVSAISNGGKVIIPQIPKSKVQKTAFRGYLRRTISLPKEDLQGVIPGMIGAAEYGTARRGVDATLGIAGKTGSCIEKGSWVGLFASVAPVADPQYSVVVITRGQGERGKYAAAIAGQIYNVLGKRMNNGNKNLAKVPLILKPQPKVNAVTSAQIDTDEGEDSDDADTPALKKVVVGKTKSSDTNQTKSKPSEIFQPVIIEPKDSMTRPRIVKKN